MKTFTKSPGATLDYVWDWSDWLGIDTIDTFQFTVPDGFTMLPGAGGEAGGKITVWFSEGTLHESYMVTCKITTDNLPPRVNERSAIFNIEYT